MDPTSRTSSPSGLLLNLQDHVVGVDGDGLRCSWIVPMLGDAQQRSYRLQITEDPSCADPLWDSGGVRSADSTGVLVQDVPLQASTPYWWRVQVDTSESGDWSVPATLHDGAVHDGPLRDRPEPVAGDPDLGRAHRRLGAAAHRDRPSGDADPCGLRGGRGSVAGGWSRRERPPRRAPARLQALGERPGHRLRKRAQPGRSPTAAHPPPHRRAAPGTQRPRGTRLGAGGPPVRRPPRRRARERDQNRARDVPGDLARAARERPAAGGAQHRGRLVPRTGRGLGPA